MLNNSFSIRKSDYKQILFLLVIAFIILGIAQDLWHAHLKNYHFYWPESLLFKSYWLYFLPIIWGITQWKTPKNKAKIVLSVFSISILQVLLATLVIYYIAKYTFYAPFRWQNIFNYLFEQHFVETLLIYGTTFAFVASKKRTTVIKQEKQRAKFITVIENKKHIPINVEKIRFIKTDRPYIVIHTSQKRFLSAMTLQQILATLNHPNFVRIHKSTIINIQYVETYTSRQNGDYDLLLKDETSLRLSRTYAKVFKEKINSTPPS